MVDDSHQNPDDPFKGTPFEGMFQMFGANQAGLGSMMGQMRQLMKPYNGVVNYDLARKTAKKVISEQGTAPQPTSGHRMGVTDALQLADMWLDRATSLPSAARHATTWTRAEWVENTMPEWQALIDPLAVHAISSMNDAIPAEVREMIGPLAAMLKQAGGAMFGQQLGTGLAHLSTEVLSSTDIGLPMGPAHTVALVPHNLAELGAGLEASETD
ncbi:MAG: zinc-dependent metalloprotease, partial [Actinomycetales bacterium]|nr:zinc-dependent metalloprotease [Actinomycetales bacterium]